MLATILISAALAALVAWIIRGMILRRRKNKENGGCGGCSGCSGCSGCGHTH